MKEIYEEPKFVIINFESSDILTTSIGDIGEWDF